MRSQLTRAAVVGDQSVEIDYADGLRVTLDFTSYLAQRGGPIVDPLKSKGGFATVRIEQGALTWATGFDICPDVLRFWCERGSICSTDETNAYFASHRSLQAS
jgi:hypothetical protein